MQTSANERAIETQNLHKEYRGGGGAPFVALHDLNLSVPRGQVFGLLGPNGAGKTTTINVLLGNVYATRGTARLLGRPSGDQRVRERIGFLPEKFQFHDFLTADEFLELHGRLYGMSSEARRKRIPEVLDLVGLGDRRKSKLREFSKGMQQRAGLAQALLNDPDLVILDEPTSALDPLGRRDVREIITTLRSQGKTVLLNSHLLSEIELTCDQVAILKGGRIVRQGRIDDLLAAPTTVQMRINQVTPELLASLGGIAHSVRATGEDVTAHIADETVIPQLVAAVVAGGGGLMALIPVRETLEDLFIRIVEGEETP
ncbi:MAG: ABC transporter ATP-binding protein [Capsulimonadaceae bacterium]